jgi:hypothetical protein
LKVQVGERSIEIGFTVGDLDTHPHNDDGMFGLDEVILKLVDHAKQIAAGQTVPALVIQAHADPRTVWPGHPDFDPVAFPRTVEEATCSATTSSETPSPETS